MKLPAPTLLLPLLLCVALLTACQDQQARTQNQELQKRVAALEAEVQALKAAQASAPQPEDSAAFEAKAAAQNCANDLARTLETFRELSIDHRYPTPAQLETPDSCAGQRVNWLKLEAQAYTFAVSDTAGQELARQSGP